MTPQEHNRFLGMAHLVYSAFQLLLAGMFSLFFWVMLSTDGSGRGGPPPVVFIIFFGMIFFFYVVMTMPSIIAGCGLLKRKAWAKTASIIAGVLSAMQFPIGTAVCVYTFWFLFSDPGKALYDKPAYQLPPPPIWSNPAASEKQREYVPHTPPDWR
jgi:hypothetical protein